MTDSSREARNRWDNNEHTTLGTTCNNHWKKYKPMLQLTITSNHWCCLYDQTVP